MPRRNRRTVDEQPDVEGVAERVLGPASTRLDGYEVRSAVNKLKRYRCPYCEGAVEPGTRHLVAMPVGSPDERRHYHSGCWAKYVKSAPARGARR